MMRARHTRDWRGSTDGNTIVQYRRGEVDDLPPHLFEVAVREGWATPVTENTSRVTHVGGGWYELESGERVRGRVNAERKAGVS